MTHFACRGCGAQVRRATMRDRTRFCNACSDKHKRERCRAAAAVCRAVRSGALLKASECSCTDCNAPANAYDHRDYTKPLEVAAVCWGCNQKRGPAFNSFWRPEQVAA
jgi:hypothetical protein